MNSAVEDEDTGRPTDIETPFGKARQLPTQIFLDAFAPPLRPGIDVEGLLNDSNLLANNGRLWGYDKKKPSEMEAKYAFTYLARCMSKLSGTFPDHEPHVVFLNNEERQWTSEGKKEDALPDAYLVTKDVSDAPEQPMPAPKAQSTLRHTLRPRNHSPPTPDTAPQPKKRRLSSSSPSIVDWTTIAVPGTYAQSANEETAQEVRPL